MTVTVASFRKDFSEFSDESKFPDGDVRYWLTMADLMLRTEVWGLSAAVATSPPTVLRDFGLELYTAHQLVLEARNRRAAETGVGIPGSQAGGVVSSESVGGVSRSYDTSAGIQPDASHWNLTNYGTRFIELVRSVGAGPNTFGVGAGPVGAAWSGPILWPPFN